MLLSTLAISLLAYQRPRSTAVVPAARSQALAPFRTQRDTPVTSFLLVANAAAFLALARSPKTFRSLAKDDTMIARGQSYRLLSSCFLHANLPHLMFNCNSLNALGKSVEPWFGSQRTAVVYASAGVAGNLLSLRLRTAPLSVGASGCIFGLLGAWYVFLQENSAYFRSRGMDVSRITRSLLESCAFTAFIGFAPGSMIDNMGHLGGALGGAAAAYAVGPRMRRSAFGYAVDEPRVRLPEAKRKRRRALRSS